MILDYDKEGNVVGMEILDASKRLDDPRAVEFVDEGARRKAAHLRGAVACTTLSAFDPGYPGGPHLCQGVAAPSTLHALSRQENCVARRQSSTMCRRSW